jgi:hypothetical protein
MIIIIIQTEYREEEKKHMGNSMPRTTKTSPKKENQNIRSQKELYFQGL